MTISGWENLGMKVYWIPILIIILIFGLVAWLAEKKPEKMRRQGKEQKRKTR